MSTSRFVQITDYCLVEYRYTSQSSPNNITANFTRIANGRTGQVQVLNVDQAEQTTGNVRERSCVQFSAGSYYDLDTDQVPDYLQFDQQMTVTQVTGNNTPYDEVRFHFLSGYNFDDLDGAVLRIDADERSGKRLTIAQLFYGKQSTYAQFNPRPVLLGQRLYDRYVRVLVPSVAIINDQYLALAGNPLQSQTLVGQLTSDGGPFLRGNPLKVSLIEVKRTEVLEQGSAEYKRYLVGQQASAAINQSDEFGLLGATVQPSQGGDYFEYFATWDGAFIEDFIERSRNLSGYDFVVIHEIRLLEQIGSQITESYSFQSVQENGFDRPNLFRPIVQAAGSAVSYSLEYTMRLYNKSNSQQLIRTASYTGYDPARWGRSLAKISLLNQPEPYRVYNKVVAGPSLQQTTFVNNQQPVLVNQPSAPVVTQLGGDAQATTVTQIVTRTVPAFFDRSLVSVQPHTLYLGPDGQLLQEPTSDTQTAYGQGDATIVVSPFDNYYKFTVLKSDGQGVQPLDLGQNARYYLVFVDNDGQKRRFEYIPDALIGDPQAGDVIFKLPGVDAESVLKFTNREFWIVSKDGSDETGIYFGEFVTSKEMDAKRERERDAQVRSSRAEQDAQIATLERRIQELQSALDSANSIQVAPPLVVDTGVTSETPRTGENVKLPIGIGSTTLSQIQVPLSELVSAPVKANKTSIVSNIVPRVIKTVGDVTLPKDLTGATIKKK